jgi:hypothetical protein
MASVHAGKVVRWSKHLVVSKTDLYDLRMKRVDFWARGSNHSSSAAVKAAQRLLGGFAGGVEDAERQLVEERHRGAKLDQGPELRNCDTVLDADAAYVIAVLAVRSDATGR